jgi:hypothetical protein
LGTAVTILFISVARTFDLRGTAFWIVFAIGVAGSAFVWITFALNLAYDLRARRAPRHGQAVRPKPSTHKQIPWIVTAASIVGVVLGVTELSYGGTLTRVHEGFGAVLIAFSVLVWFRWVALPALKQRER